RSDNWQHSDEIAKAPKTSWRPYWHFAFNWPERGLPDRFDRQPHGRRRGFRHELATVLGLLELLARYNSRHDALRGDNAELEEWFEPPAFDSRPEAAVAEPLDRLRADEFNLLLYLIAAHHGKVRLGLQMTADDQDFR